jgi:hypothetical protein
MERLRDRDVAPGKPLDGRPARTMPGKVQQANGDTRIDDVGTRQRVVRQPVLPGTGEEGQPVTVAQSLQERGGEPVRVLAHTRALAERRPVIDHNAHVGANRSTAPNDGKSLGINRLTAFFRLC